MTKRLTKELSVGIIITLALLIFAIGIMAVGEESKFFARKVYYLVNFPNTNGLSKGSPVSLSGVQVGTVDEINLPIDPQFKGIDIKIAVDKVYESRIREETRASLKFLQILSGEKYIELTPGDPVKPALPPGSKIPVEEEMRFIETGENIAENLNEITNTLRKMLEPIDRGEGILGEVFTNPEFGKEGLANLKSAIDSTNAILAKVKSGEGLIGKLIYDEETAKDIVEIKNAINKVNSLLEKVDRREGAIGDLLTEGGKGEQTLEELKEAAAKINRIAERLDSKTGLIGKLLNDEEYSENVAADFRKLVAHLASITEKIDKGEGTVGALINDPTVYEDLRNVVQGVKSSKIAGGLIRHYKKKGEKQISRSE
ncbi:MAG: MlaD family protein [Acidobacteriota bacterium]